MSASSQLFTRDFGLVVACNFLQGLAASSMLTVPLYLDHLGANRAEIGLIMASGAVGGLLARPVVGWALEVKGRKPTLAVGTLLLLLAMFLFGQVVEISALVFVARITAGISVGALFSGYLALASDIVPPDRRTEGIALYGVSGLLGFLVNPLIGELHLDPADLRFVFPALIVPAALSLLSLYAIRGRDHERVDRERPTVRSLIQAAAQPSLWSVWWAAMTFSGLVGLFATFAGVAAENRGIPRPSAIWAMYSLGAVLIRVAGARIPDLVGPARLVPPAIITYAAAAVVLSAASTTSGFLWAGLLAGISHGIAFPILVSLVTARVSDHQHGVTLTAYTGIWEFTALVGPPLFGVVADAFGFELTFRAAAIFSLVALILWWPIERVSARAVRLG